MAKVIDNNGHEMDAEVNVREIDNVLGLVFESRGGRERNNDYNNALEVILGRLKKAGVDSIKVVIVSSDLLKSFKDPIDRTLEINNSTYIKLINHEAKEIRVKLGNAQTKIKDDPTTQGGSPVKRIQLISNYLDIDEWETIITGDLKSKKTRLKPTFDINQFEKDVDELLKNPDEQIPKGNNSPGRRLSTSPGVIERDPAVKAWVLKNANGICENCEKEGPFLKGDGKYYLEVHHVNLLSNGGADTVDNAIAVCPNCHRELHFGLEKELLVNDLYTKVERLNE